ncbi:MAG: acyl-CoA dehydrogenase family protein, partial [Pseudomonadota bacterium]
MERRTPANQSEPFDDVNLFVADQALQAAVIREGAAFAVSALEAFGAEAGSAEMQRHARRANTHPPSLETHDPRGERVDRIVVDESYHALMRTSMAVGLHARSFSHLAGSETVATGTNVARAAGVILASQMEPGHVAPLSMTNASIAALLNDAGMAQTMVPKILEPHYDPRLRHMSEKASLTVSLALSERHGVSDLASARTRAERIGDESEGNADGYRLNGEKWFLSAPMSDAFLVLAEAPGGLSCFMMPRVLPDGEMNGIQFNRLKPTLGHHALAVVDAVFDDAQAWPVGEAGAARTTLADTLALMRLDGALVTLGLMRRAVSEAIHHARQRRIGGAPLVGQPLAAQVLADMALHTEAATALTLRLARAFDQPDDEQERAWARLMTPVTAYWVCKSAPHLIAEAMECLGGNGFAEDFPLATLYREAPAHALWQGGGNILALDVMQVLQRDP